MVMALCVVPRGFSAGMVNTQPSAKDNATRWLWLSGVFKKRQ
jgi:hypothetical protein